MNLAGCFGGGWSGGTFDVLGWVFLHSLWQGLAVAAGLAAVLACLPRGSAASIHIRYLACVMALLAVPLFAGMTAAGVCGTASAVADGRWSDGAAAATWGGSSIELSSHRLASWLAPLGLAWAAGAGLGALRMAAGWLLSRRMVAMASCDRRLERQADHWRGVLGIARDVRVRLSSAVTVPVVVGMLRPVVLWPAATFTGFDPQHVEAILVHELAHVRRHDPLVNLLQALIETIFFHHPAVWWISGRVRDEREHCADELAVVALGQPTTAARLRYATALVMLEERQRGRPAFAVASNGGCLVGRIGRLVGVVERGSGRGRLAATLVAASVAVGCCLAGGASSRGPSVSHTKAPASEAGEMQSPAVATVRTPDESRHHATSRLRAAAAMEAWARQRADRLLVELQAISVRAAAAFGRHAGIGKAVEPGAAPGVEAAAGGFQVMSLGSLTPEMAAAIAKLPCVELDLDSVHSLSADAATALATFRGRRISLDGLEALSEDAARGLSGFGNCVSAEDDRHGRGGTEIRLGGLKTLNPEVIDGFAAYDGTLHLPGVTTLDVSTAAALARLSCGVSLPNLQPGS